MFECLTNMIGGSTFVAKEKMGWLQSNHFDKELFMFVKPKVREWPFNTTQKVSKLPFVAVTPSQEAREIIDSILQFANKVNKKLKILEYYNKESLNDLTRQTLDTSSCEY